MTVLRAGVFALALVGVILPFVVVSLILGLLYPPQTTGLPIPLIVSIPCYLFATAVAACVIFLCYQIIRQDRESSDKKDGLDDPEDLPY